MFNIAERNTVMSVVSDVGDPMLKFSFMASTPVSPTAALERYVYIDKYLCPTL